MSCTFKTQMSQTYEAKFEDLIHTLGDADSLVLCNVSEDQLIHCCILIHHAKLDGSIQEG